MISGQSVALSLAALCLVEDGLVIAVLFRRTFCKLLRGEKTFTVQISEPSLQILGGFTQISRSCSSQLLCLGVSLLLLPLLGCVLLTEKGGGGTCWI